jgi:hypothetical protein
MQALQGKGCVGTRPALRPFVARARQVRTQVAFTTAQELSIVSAKLRLLSSVSGLDRGQIANQRQREEAATAIDLLERIYLTGEKTQSPAEITAGRFFNVEKHSMVRPAILAVLAASTSSILSLYQSINVALMQHLVSPVIGDNNILQLSAQHWRATGCSCGLKEDQSLQVHHSFGALPGIASDWQMPAQQMRAH